MREQEWKIQARGENCFVCKTPFSDGEEFVSALSFDENGYQRADFCSACWEKITPAIYLSFWHTVFHLPAPKPEEPLKKETVESLLRRLIAEKNDQHRNAVYVLAVMLERKRILVERDVQTDENGSKVRVYEHRHSGETFWIPDPELKLTELEHVREDVLFLLDGDKSHMPDKTALEREQA